MLYKQIDVAFDFATWTNLIWSAAKHVCKEGLASVSLKLKIPPPWWNLSYNAQQQVRLYLNYKLDYLGAFFYTLHSYLIHYFHLPKLGVLQTYETEFIQACRLSHLHRPSFEPFM